LVSKAMDSGYNQYAPMPGILELREAIYNKFQLLYNSSYHPETDCFVISFLAMTFVTAIEVFVHKF